MQRLDASVVAPWQQCREGFARMWMESDSMYFSRRARQERDAARKAVNPKARDAHLTMAQRFSKLSEAIAAGERHWGAAV